MKPSRCVWLGQRTPVPIAARTLACQPPALIEDLLRTRGGVGVHAIDDLARDRFVGSSDAVGLVDSRQIESRFVLVRRCGDSDLTGPPSSGGVSVWFLFLDPRTLDHALAAGKTRIEAMRCLKRRISDAIYRQLFADARAKKGTARRTRAREGTAGRLKNPARLTFPRTSTLRISHFPDPRNRRYNRDRIAGSRSAINPSSRLLDTSGEPERRGRGMSLRVARQVCSSLVGGRWPDDLRGIYVGPPPERTKPSAPEGLLKGSPRAS